MSEETFRKPSVFSSLKNSYVESFKQKPVETIIATSAAVYSLGYLIRAVKAPNNSHR